MVQELLQNQINWWENPKYLCKWKYIAKGEVVVIDDNFGIRITDIDNSYGG